ncbi:MAG: 3-isopropylmalate dehydratase small subunit [Candidatus Bathyarchaeia archaeon]
MVDVIVSKNIHIFGDNISTDLIIPGKYKFKTTDATALAEHAMEGADPEFSKKAQEGDIIIGGENFGCGSSREQAPLALKGLGIKAIVAKSFARIFYRNALNLGIPLIESRDIVDDVKPGDVLEIDFKNGFVKNLRLSKTYRIKPIPAFLLNMIDAGGLVPFYRKYGRLPWQEL